MSVTPTREARFWSKVRKTETCWLWTASLVTGGYGHFWTGSRLVGAHRFAWELANGPVPIGYEILHRCDIPACVRPDHLFLGTHQDNMADRGTKGRTAKGDHHGMVILTTAQVLTIRQRCAVGGETHRALAAEFGVRRQTVTDIANARRWRWLLATTEHHK